jgi:endonuclease YncB( thermonuclease family)
VRNHDGDTLTVNLPNSIPDVFGHEIPVRIRHIDTPEITGNGKCEKEAAQKAKVATTSLLKNAKKIDLEDVGRDKYFRLLATVRADGVSIGQYLIDQKLAVPYEGDTKQVVDWCTMQRKIK